MCSIWNNFEIYHTLITMEPFLLILRHKKIKRFGESRIFLRRAVQFHTSRLTENYGEIRSQQLHFSRQGQLLSLPEGWITFLEKPFGFYSPDIWNTCHHIPVSLPILSNWAAAGSNSSKYRKQFLFGNCACVCHVPWVIIASIKRDRIVQFSLLIFRLEFYFHFDVQSSIYFYTENVTYL